MPPPAVQLVVLLMPVICTGAEVMTVLRGTLLWSMKVKPPGVVSATAAVVLVKVSATPPTVTKELVAVLTFAEEVWKTHI